MRDVADDASALRARPDLFAEIARLREAGSAFCVLTVVRTQSATSAKAGAKAIVTEDGAMIGHLGGGCVRAAALEAAEEALRSGAARLIRVTPDDAPTDPSGQHGVAVRKNGCPSGGTADIFIEPYRLAPGLAILGGGPVAVALSRMADAMDYRVLRAAPDAELDDLALRPRDFVVVAAQGERDLEALRAAVSGPTTYVGMVASRAKAAYLSRRLIEEGVTPERLARLKAPAGVDIGGIEPEEIALSILAEIIQRRRAGERGEQ